MNELEFVINDTKETLNVIRPCHSCIFANDKCTWCREKKININPNKQGCETFMTNEDALRKIAELEYEKYQKDFKKNHLDLDTICYTINAASIMLEKLDQKLDKSYAEKKEITREMERNHNESKKNRDRLKKAFFSMKANIMDMRNTYNKYVEYFFTHQFTDEFGKYDWKEADKNLSNAGTITKVIKLFVDRALDNDENAVKMFEFMEALKGSGVYEEEDFNSGLIKK